MNAAFFIQLLINGLLLGGFYATMALGFSTIWGVMRLINLAHGEFLLLAAFIAWFFFNPTREQTLTITTLDVSNVGLVTYIVMAVVFAIIGLVVSEGVIGRAKMPNDAQRRLLGIGGLTVLGLVLTAIWQSFGFPPVVFPMMVIVMVWLALASGFMISHVVLKMGLDVKMSVMTRQLVSYGAGAVIAVVFYLAWQASGFASLDPFLTLPVIFVLFFGLGYLLQYGFFNRLVEGPYLTMLLVTFAVAIIAQSIMLQIYAADPRRINVDYGNALSLGGAITVSPTKLFTVLVSMLMIAGLVAFLRYTRAGYAIRAAAQNKMAAKLMGININEVYALTFAISLGLTAMAGAMMGTFQPVSPVNGPIWTLRAFAIVALGGLGKVQGVVVGGIVLGIAESYIGGYIGIGWAIAVAFIMLVVMLVVRPQGITGGLVPVEE